MALHAIPRSDVQGIAGVKYVLLAEWNNLTISIDASTHEATFTADGSLGDVFFKVEPNDFGSNGATTGAGTTTGTYVDTPTLTMFFSGKRNITSVIRLVKVLKDTQVVAVVVYNDGQARLYGDDDRGLILSAPTSATGTAGSDQYGETIVLSNTMKDPPAIVTSAVLATLQ